MRCALLFVLAASAAHAEPRDDLRLSVDLTAEINLAHNNKARPLSFAPDVWIGLERWTLGLVHSNASVDRFAPGASFCVRTDTLYCDSFYRGSGLDARYLALDSELQVSPRLRALARDLEPWKPALTAGALVEWRRGRYSIASDPYIQVGLANTDQGNRSALFVPIELAIAPMSRLRVALHTGWNGEFAVLRDGWHIPVAAEVRGHATEAITVGATLGFASLLGPQNTPKQRVLFVTVSWRSR